MVARYKRQVRSGEIGVIRADMSVANSLGQISNAVSKMSNEAFKMAADGAEERGRDYISSKTDDEIFGIDPETGQPKNVMTELLANLPTKGYGMIAQEAIKSEASKRFGIILETKFREQGANAQAKFPLNPGKAKSMLEEFTDELASKYEGEYKNDLKNGFGKHRSVDNEEYEGEFKDNKYDGKGTFLENTKKTLFKECLHARKDKFIK